MKRLFTLSKAFLIPLIVIGGIIFFEIFHIYHLPTLANVIILAVILLGSYSMLKETVINLSKKQFGVDYIAILAIVVAVITGEYLVAAILALMVSGGRNLEDYGVSMAKKSLTALVDRVPSDITLWKDNLPHGKEKIENISVGTEIFIRKGEVIGLDGILISEIGEIDESSLTGEPYFIEKVKGDVIRSGTVNFGQPIIVKVTSSEKDSTYKKIIDMVKQAQEEKSPMVRLADQYSTVFTLATLVIAGFAYLTSHFDLSRVLAVLAVATPCPLIIATPIALLGGINASAKRKIIVKRLQALEVLSRVNTVLFDKTGTITLGIPKLTQMVIEDRQYTENHVLSIAEAIERNSLHPLAKAILSEAKRAKAKTLSAIHINETIGKGISGVVEGKEYTLSKVKSTQGMSIELTADRKKIALFHFEDEIKTESKETIKNLINHGLHLKILTGDKKEAVQKVVQSLGSQIEIHAECTPDAKRQEVEDLRNRNKVIAMVGDGINDAPALALADVGLAFSNQEQTAASEAADIVFLGGNFSMVLQSLTIAKRTIAIARQSILWGIGLSTVAMCFASAGLIPPIIGAAFQEAIDIAVIFNALRASK
jgi:heavy metal translocating P-type ATPase